MKNFLLLSALMLSLTACRETESPDGTFPNEYVDQVAQLEGAYSGSFEGVSGTLNLKLQGNRPQVEFVASNGSADLLGGSCGSRIGRLLSYKVDEKGGSYSLELARFEFHPGNCQRIEGRSLNLSFKQTSTQTRIKASVLKKAEQQPDHCTPSPDGIDCTGGGILLRHLNGSFAN